jgi:hypothetical protein
MEQDLTKLGNSFMNIGCGIFAIPIIIIFLIILISLF